MALGHYCYLDRRRRVFALFRDLMVRNLSSRQACEAEIRHTYRSRIIVGCILVKQPTTICRICPEPFSNVMHVMHLSEKSRKAYQ